jgi:DNA-binding SARP family transcriptional activator
VLPELRSLCAVEPRNEQAHASRMITHAAAGHQAPPHQVFADVRHRLDAELGISPGVVLVHAHAQVMRGR